ncbi:MAG TPA: hypothetical protein DD379_22110 [Cyanobacteria bacterium UBA11162]|nr:hypothetical protein [Cyanobacteria bacterium UBA11162]
MVKFLTFVGLIYYLSLLPGYPTLNKKSTSSVDERESIVQQANIVPLKIGLSDKTEYEQQGKKAMISANNSVSFQEIISIPWDKNSGIPELFVGNAQTSIMTSKVPRRMRAPVSMRVTPWGGIDILAYNPAYSQGVGTKLYHFSPQGKLVSSVEINPPSGVKNGWRIVDFISDQNGNIYLIENYQPASIPQNYLRKLTPQGQPIWERSGAFNSQKLDVNNLEGDFRQLLIDENSIPYLAATQYGGLVVQINAENGSLETYADLREWTGEVFMDGKGKIYYVRYLPEKQTRCWTNYDPTLKKETLVNCDRNLYGLLDTPIGVDRQERGYAANGMSISRIGNDLSILQPNIDNIVLVEGKNTIYTSNFNALENGGEINIHEWKSNSISTREIKLKIPENVIPQGREVGRLTYLDLEGNYYIYAGETPTADGTLIVYSPEGIIKDQQKPAPDIHLHEYRLQGSRSWGVDLEGNIYLPLLGPTGLHVIKINPQ